MKSSNLCYGDRSVTQVVIKSIHTLAFRVLKDDSICCLLGLNQPLKFSFINVGDEGRPTLEMISYLVMSWVVGGYF